MTTRSTVWPPLRAMSSSPVLIVLQAMTPQVASFPSPGSMPSVFRARYGDITRPWLLAQTDGVSSVTPHTTKPSPGALHVPPGGVDASFTLNFGELWSVMRYITNPVVGLVTSMSDGTGPLPSTERRAPEICHHE